MYMYVYTPPYIYTHTQIWAATPPKVKGKKAEFPIRILKRHGYARDPIYCSMAHLYALL